jgi:23S rRNA pseudouridine955/2504/2580 synthase
MGRLHEALLPRMSNMEIIYADKRIVVAVKPVGVLSTDEPGGMPELLRKEFGTECIRTVHRLDAQVSGLMVFARSAKAASLLSRQIRDHRFHKEYLAVVSGHLAETLVLKDRMVRDERDNRSHLLAEDGGEGSDRDDGKWMETIVTPVSSGQRFTLVRVRILTGRTHQIRLHLAEAGYPILGDPKYGDRRLNEQIKKQYSIRGQLLHCASMAFHQGPLSGQTIECPPPDAFTKIQNKLCKETAAGNERRKHTDR